MNTKGDPANWSVSREEAEQMMHDTVNAYYAHALNDPTMSHDEAIASTAEVAERGYSNLEAAYGPAPTAGTQTGTVEETQEETTLEPEDNVTTTGTADQEIGTGVSAENVDEDMDDDIDDDL